MRIGFVIGRIGGVDGVALETEKWLQVLRRMGHTCKVLTGDLEGKLDDVTVAPAFSFDHPATIRIQDKAFGRMPATEAGLKSEVDEVTKAIEQELLAWIDREKLDCLVSENANALPFHLAMGLAIQRVLERTKLLGVTHDHDFLWERGDRYKTSYAYVQEILDKCFPIREPNVVHAVINKAAQDTLVRKLGIEKVVVVPNVMDFDKPFGQLDAYNADLRQELGVTDDDILLFQITRVVRRKGIETAIDLVAGLRDPKVKLVITGSDRDDDSGYLEELRQRACNLDVQDRVLFASARFDNQRRIQNGQKIYALHDGYAHAAAMTYFSTYEGFGNAFVEAVVAKVPVFVNDYKPVYWPDIGSLGFKTVLIEDAKLTPQAIKDAERVLHDPALRQEMTLHNFALGSAHFSYQALERILSPLFQE